METLALFIGLWTTTCIQTQITGKSGFVIESYRIEESAQYEFSRRWHSDKNCTKEESTDLEKGTLKLGSKLSSMFISGDAFEADFTSRGSTDLGALSVKEETLNVARGFRNTSSRNTMLGLFGYKRSAKK